LNHRGVNNLNKINEKLQRSISNEKLDAIMLVGVDNFTYASQIVLPFAYNNPEKTAVVIKINNGNGSIICPFEWGEAIRDQGWKGDIFSYNENVDVFPRSLIKVLRKVIKQLELNKSKIGIDEARVSKVFRDVLVENLPNVKWVPFNNSIRELRIIKTPQEVKLIESAAYQSELGIITALMHLEGTVDIPGYTINEFTERLRVHVFEFGGSGVGHVATQMGVNSQMFYSPQRGVFRDGELVRMDMSNHLRGYWSNAGRMAVIGNTNSEQVIAYENNLKLKAIAIGMLRDGVRCDEVFIAVKNKADEAGIRFFEDAGIGHGVGVSHREPPFLNPFDKTVLRAGMVLAVDVYTYGPRQELMHSKDIYEITGNGVKLLSWYKTWDSLYAVKGFRSTH
jgi:Xaa-Pro dipeptidase